MKSYDARNLARFSIVGRDISTPLRFMRMRSLTGVVAVLK